MFVLPIAPVEANTALSGALVPLPDHYDFSPDAEAIKQLINDPLLARIAYCESGFRQFEENGDVVKSYYGTSDYGLFQINKVNFSTAKRLGYDVMTLEGNIKFAQYLYSKNGTADWVSSKPCWSKPIAGW